ncbi:MAG: hypothetical protein ABFC89_00530 [Methanospirillum sp.]
MTTIVIIATIIVAAPAIVREPGETGGAGLPVPLLVEEEDELPLLDAVPVLVVLRCRGIENGERRGFVEQARVLHPPREPADEQPADLLIRPPGPLLHMAEGELLHPVPRREREDELLVPVHLLPQRSAAAVKLGKEPRRVPEIVLRRRHQQPVVPEPLARALEAADERVAGDEVEEDLGGAAVADRGHADAAGERDVDVDQAVGPEQAPHLAADGEVDAIGRAAASVDPG